MAPFSARFPQALLLALTIAPLTPSHLSAQSPIESLKSSFKNPPADAKPMMRWWWFGAAVEKPEILRELQQMKADGIGGAELAFVYPEVLDDPAKEPQEPPLPLPRHARRRPLRPGRRPQARPPHRRHPLQRLALRRPRHHARRSRRPPPHRRSPRPRQRHLRRSAQTRRRRIPHLSIHRCQDLRSLQL